MGPQYTKAVYYGLGQMIVIFVLGALALDGGGLLRQAAGTILLYLTLAAFVVLRRPFTPTNWDLFVLKYAMVIMFGVVFTLDTVFPTFHAWFVIRRHH